MEFGRPHATETYCLGTTDPVALSGVSDFVAGHEIGEMKNVCSRKDGLVENICTLVWALYLVPMPGTCCRAPGARHLALGARHLVLGTSTWHLVSGAVCLNSCLEVTEEWDI